MKSCKERGVYKTPQIRVCSVLIERGFSVSSEDFEQPEFGGEDNL